jgi:hypothetical protein
MRNAMLNTIPKANFLRAVIEATNNFRTLYHEGSAVVVKSSAKIDKVNDAIAASGLDTDLKKAIKNLIEVMVDGKACCDTTRKPTQDELDKQFLVFTPNACVVPLRNRNNHLYTLGKPVIMVYGCPGRDSDMFGMDARGVIHCDNPNSADGKDHLPRLRKSLRPATNAEIMWLIDKLYE